MTTSVLAIPSALSAQQRLRLTQFSVDHATDAIYWVAPDGRILYANDQVVQSLGYSQQELLSMHVPEIDPLVAWEAWPERWRELKERRFVEVESIHRRRDGSEFPVWIHASYYQDDDIELSFACCRDISEKKAVESALRQANEQLEQRVTQRTAELAASEARYQDLYQNAPDMFASIDADSGQVVQCNRTLVEATGFAMEDLLNRRFEELFDPACHAEAQSAWEAFLAAGEVRGRELALRHQEGGKIEVSLNMSAIRDPQGRILRGRSTFRDVTDYRRVEQQIERHRSELAHVARLATTGEMAAGLAHELNQPLYALNNFAQGALRRLETGSLDHPSLLDVLKDIASESQRAAEIIRSVRRYISKREPQRSIVDVNESVRRVVQLLAGEARRRHCTIETQLSESTAQVHCDEIQIKQVLVNLILNGMEAMADLEEPARRVVVRSEALDAAVVRLSVSDSGTGLAPDDAERVFDAFYTTKPEGIGLGLTISRTIVESHGGRISVTANPQRGVTFAFTLPRVAQV